MKRTPEILIVISGSEDIDKGVLAGALYGFCRQFAGTVVSDNKLALPTRELVTLFCDKRIVIEVAGEKETRNQDND